MKKKNIVAVFVFAMMAMDLAAQPDKGNPDIAPTPFGAVEILIAAGAALGGKKAWDARKKKEENN